MKFDFEVHRKFNGKVIDYGFVKGNNIILFIKAGQNGSMHGFNYKYLKIALNINKKYGYTVIASSNPFDGNNPLDDAFEVIEDYVKNERFEDYKVYYMGHSNGAMIGANWGYKYSKIKRMLLINSPLMFNWHKIKEGIKNFEGEKCVFVYGEFDQSYSYTELLKPLLNDHIQLEIIKGQDHDFSKDINEFIELPEKYIINML